MKTSLFVNALVVFLFSQALVGLAQTSSDLTTCKSNLKWIGSALEKYAADHGGKYPSSLRALTPKYLDAPRTCPSTGRDTYSASYRAGGPQMYTFCCQGENHAALGYGANQPSYDGVKGLELGRQNPANAAGATIVFPSHGSQYQIQIPNGWLLKSDNAYGTTLSNGAATMSVGLSNDRPDKANYYQNFMSNPETKKLDLIKPRKFTLGTFTGVRTAVKSDNGLMTELWGCTDGTRSLQLIMQCPQGQYNKLKPSFEKLCRSLRAAR